jgi:methylmalonyl-CoA mutase cobalamin-binding subunit
MSDAARQHQPEHPIGVAAERTGLSPDVLRVWERRYGAVRPRRTDGRQRWYTDAEIERLRLLHQATLAGRSIRQVVSLSTDALARLVDEDTAGRLRAPKATPAPPAVAPGSPALGAATCPATVARGMEKAVVYDADGLDGVLRHALGTLGLPVFVESVAQPLLHQVDTDFQAGRLTAAQAHLVAGAVRRFTITGMQCLAPASSAARVVVAALPGARCEASALFVAAGAMSAGWRVTYLGVDLPAADIARTARATDARAVAVSVRGVGESEAMWRGIHALRSQLPDSVALLAVGRGAGGMSGDPDALGVRFAERVADVLPRQQDELAVTAR